MKQPFSLYLSILSVLIPCFFAGCFSSQSIRRSPYYLQPPPGGVAINDSVWYDRTEVTNGDWNKYLHWIARVYGKEHEVYLTALPDTNVWERNSGAPLFGEPMFNGGMYLRHPAFRHYPVTGVSQQQAEDYSKWRSDRVYEELLVRHFVIIYNSNQTPENHFTIERFQRGEFETFNFVDPFLHYPVYRLPETFEFAEALHYDDSVQQVRRPLTLRNRRCHTSVHSAETTETADLYISVALPSMRPAGDPKCKRALRSRIINLRENASEWLAPYGITAEDNCLAMNLFSITRDALPPGSPNAWTGFRNVVTWRFFLHDSLFGAPVSDIDGNIYSTIHLAGSLWMAENLRTTRFSDGEAIPFVQRDSAWAVATGPAYGWHPDSTDWPRSITGAYYNRYAMETGTLCPAGWRIPSKQDWESIAQMYGGVTGGAMKLTGYSQWAPPNRGATNVTGFSAFGAGTRFPEGGFSHPGMHAFWWSTHRDSDRFYYAMALSYRKKVYEWMLAETNHGVNVRCIKNNNN